MKYPDDINIAEFKEIPTYKRIQRNARTCKYIGFTLLTKGEKGMGNNTLRKYKNR